MGFPGDSDNKESACYGGDLGSIPGSGRSPEEGNAYLGQYSCLENPMDRGACWATVRGVTKNWTRLSDIVKFVPFSFVHFPFDLKTLFNVMFGFLSLLEKRNIYFMIPLYKIFRTGKCIETESILVVACGWRKEN